MTDFTRLTCPPPLAEEPDPVARLIRAARAVLRDQRERRGLVRGSSSRVDALEDALVAVEGEKARGS